MKPMLSVLFLWTFAQHVSANQCQMGTFKEIQKVSATMNEACKCNATPINCQPASPPNCFPKVSNQNGASSIIKQIPEANTIERDRFITNQFREGNFPQAMTNLKQVHLGGDGQNQTKIEIFTTADYIALGNEKDFLRTPLRPDTAQELADQFGMVLPSSKVVDAIYAQATVRVKAYPISPPDNTMANAYRFPIIDESVRKDLANRKISTDYGNFLAGHKKDVVIGAAKGKVRIYGWARNVQNPNLEDRNNRIQNEWDPHDAIHADYSHGIRFVSQWVYVTKKGICKPMLMNEALMDPELCPLVSKTCPMQKEFLKATH